jgi:Ca2+:H+ antiporter
MGASMFAGGLGRSQQRFNRVAANTQSGMLLLAACALIMPAIFELVNGHGLPTPGAARVDYDSTVEHLSLFVALVLIATYIAGLLFSLKTHRSLFNPPHVPEEHGREPWSVRRSVGMLAIAGIAVAAMSEVLVGSIEDAASSIGLTEFFVGAIVVAIAGNAAEHWVAVSVARKDRMDLSVNIAIGSSAQIALFVAPVLVLASFVLGPAPLPLVFNGFELGAFLLAVLIANHVTNEGESTWFEGLQLLAVYAVVALAFGFA